MPITHSVVLLTMGILLLALRKNLVSGTPFSSFRGLIKLLGIANIAMVVIFNIIALF